MDFTERMEAGRDAAAHRRHRGLTTGKSAAGWDVQPTYDDEGTWHATLYVARQGWELARDEIRSGHVSRALRRSRTDLGGNHVYR